MVDSSQFPVQDNKDRKEQPTQLEVTEYRLHLDRRLRQSETPQLRGFFGRAFADEVLLHHHRPDGSLLYEYPRVQFKILDQTALLLGLAEGSELLARLWLEVDQTILGSEDMPVLESTITRRKDWLGETVEPLEYRLLTPWLALNQENERRYVAARSGQERQALLEATLVGNCLSLAKAFGHQVSLRLRADCQGLRPVKASLKGVSMRGFVGAFRVNFLLPDRIGIGKSVSRGFGTVERVPPGPFRNDGPTRGLPVVEEANP